MFDWRIPIALALSVITGCAGPAARFDPVTMQAPATEPPARNVELAIPSHGVRLPAYLMLAGDAGPHPAALLLHGYPGNEKNLDLAQSLRRAGVHVLFIHYRGAWGAEGTFRIDHMHRDALAALDFLRDNADEYGIDPDRLAVIGHSMGGFAALRTAAADASVACAVGIAAANLGNYARRSRERKAGFAAYSDNLFMLSGWDGATALLELEANGREFELGSLGPTLEGRPVLLITGAEDTVVPVTVQRDLAARWAAGPGPELTALEIPGDHAFAANRIALQRAVVEWIMASCLDGDDS